LREDGTVAGGAERLDHRARSRRFQVGRPSLIAVPGGIVKEVPTKAWVGPVRFTRKFESPEDLIAWIEHVEDQQAQTLHEGGSVDAARLTQATFNTTTLVTDLEQRGGWNDAPPPPSNRSAAATRMVGAAPQYDQSEAFAYLDRVREWAIGKAPREEARPTRPVAGGPDCEANGATGVALAVAPIQLRGQGNPVVVLGKEYTPLAPKQYAIINALVQHQRSGKPNGLTKGALEKMGFDHGANVIGQLVRRSQRDPKMAPWHEVISRPDKNRGRGYLIVSPPQST
jgi:hypothetical protein